MNKLTLSGATNFALTTDALAFMQSSYEALEKLGALGGDNYIVSGCEVSGSSVTSGWIFLKGKLMPFTGGTIQTNVRIIKTINTINVDIASREQTTYHAEFGTSANPEDNVPWATLSANRILNLLALNQAKVDKVEGSRLIADTEAEKLAGIETEANKYVHPSNPAHQISEINGLTDALNSKVQILHKGSFNVGDIVDGNIVNDSVTISFGKTLTTTNYIVLGSIVLNNATAEGNKDTMTWSVYYKGTTSMKIYFEEGPTSVQDISFDYVLIAL
jgi:hypothetical protein